MSAKTRNNSRVTNHISVSPERPWTSKDVDLLRKSAHLGAEAVAELLERSIGAVRQQAWRMRISLRRLGERRGLILGQPRGVSLRSETATALNLGQLREDVLVRAVDPGRIERRVRDEVLGTELCPGCARRPQEVKSMGLCENCHLRLLAEAHRLEPDRIEAQRELDRERQRKSRRRRREDQQEEGA